MKVSCCGSPLGGAEAGAAGWPADLAAIAAAPAAGLESTLGAAGRGASEPSSDGVAPRESPPAKLEGVAVEKKCQRYVRSAYMERSTH